MLQEVRHKWGQSMLIQTDVSGWWLWKQEYFSVIWQVGPNEYQRVILPLGSCWADEQTLLSYLQGYLSGLEQALVLDAKAYNIRHSVIDNYLQLHHRLASHLFELEVLNKYEEEMGILYDLEDCIDHFGRDRLLQEVERNRRQIIADNESLTIPKRYRREPTRLPV